jgi:uncharacterized protein YoxC
MGPGGIATIIAASALAVIAIAIAYAIIRLGRLIDEASAALRDIKNETAPLIEEVTTTVSLVNGPLQSINKISKSAEELSTKVTGAAGSFIDKNGSLLKIAGALFGAAKARKDERDYSRSESERTSRGKRKKAAPEEED